MKHLFAALAFILYCALGTAHEPLPPGYGELGYAPPAPGSYRLPPLGRAADGEVLDTRGETRSLGALLDGRVTVLSFVYQSCHDTSGCPLATTVLHRIRQDTAREPALAERLRLISLSFDPERDTPEHMAHLAHNFRFVTGGADWLFLTTASQEKLQPILDAYGQAVIRERGPDGEETRDLAHVLRVFLIDSERRIRNIYSPSFLHPDLVLNDVRTLLAEAPPSEPISEPMSDSEPVPVSAHAVTAGSGDNKTGYERPDYRTRSLSLAVRRGRPVDLLANLKNPPLGLPPVPVPADAPLTPETVAIGRKLFFDRRLSLNGTFSCAMCHIPEQGFASNELRTAVGIEGRTVRRNAPGLLNAGYSERLFHDGREIRLEHQVWEPLLAANEMGNPSIASVVEKVRRLPDYQGLFEDAFARGPTMETIGQALASYERTLNCGDSPFDSWYYGGEQGAIGDAAERGFAVFMGKGGCAACHRIEPEHALFTDGALHNTGIGYLASMAREPATRRIQVAPGVTLDVAAAVIGKVSEAPPSDLGRYEITLDPDDRWKYKTPSLRNLTLTAPYMHDGSIATLAEVVAFYDRGGIANPLLDPRIRRLDLSAREQTDLVAFLETLTGRCDDLVADAFAAPVGDARPDDPPWWE